MRMMMDEVRRAAYRRPDRRDPDGAVRCRSGGIAGTQRPARRWRGHRRGRSYRSRGAASGSECSAALLVSPRLARRVLVGVKSRSASRILRSRPRMEVTASGHAVGRPVGVQPGARAGSPPSASPAAHGHISGGRSRGQSGRASGPGERDCTGIRRFPPRSAVIAPAGHGALLRVARADSHSPVLLASERAAMSNRSQASLPCVPSYRSPFPAWRTGCTAARVAPNGDSIAKRLVRVCAEERRSCRTHIRH